MHDSRTSRCFFSFSTERHLTKPCCWVLKILIDELQAHNCFENLCEDTKQRNSAVVGRVGSITYYKNGNNYAFFLKLWKDTRIKSNIINISHCRCDERATSPYNKAAINRFCLSFCIAAVASEMVTVKREHVSVFAFWSTSVVRSESSDALSGKWQPLKKEGNVCVIGLYGGSLYGEKTHCVSQRGKEYFRALCYVFTVTSAPLRKLSITAILFIEHLKCFVLRCAHGAPTR